MVALSAVQCRIIGVMLEKETTTPEHYPISINGITTACNQKSNRDPVMLLNEDEVQNSVDELVKMNQLIIDHNATGRVSKYMHRFCDTEFGNLKFSAQQKAIICLLMLRGPQTLGELRTRANPLADFADVPQVETTLAQLQNLNGQTLVKKLARESGKRKSRYVHLFSSVSDSSSAEVHFTKEISLTDNNQLIQHVTELEQQVATLTE